MYARAIRRERQLIAVFRFGLVALGICDRERYPPANQTPRLPPWSRPSADPGIADGVDRYQSGQLPVVLKPRRVAALSPVMLPPPAGMTVGLPVGTGQSAGFNHQSHQLPTGW